MPPNPPNNMPPNNIFGIDSIKLEIFVFYGLICLGIILKLFVNNSNTYSETNGKATSTIWGYGLALVGIIALFFINMAPIYKRKFNLYSKNTFMDFINNILFTNIIYILIIIILVLYILLNTFFYRRINLGLYPELYGNLNTVSTVIIILQVIILYTFIDEQLINLESKKSQLLQAIISLLSGANMIILVIMYIIIEYYSTDG